MMTLHTSTYLPTYLPTYLSTYLPKNSMAVAGRFMMMCVQGV